MYMLYIYIHICICMCMYMYVCIHIYIYIYTYLTQRVFPTSSWCLLRRWTGDPPDTLNGLTSNPLSLMW